MYILTLGITLESQVRKFPDKYHSLIEELSSNEKEGPFCVARVLVQKVVQLAALHPNRHRVLCLNRIVDVYF